MISLAIVLPVSAPNRMIQYIPFCVWLPVFNIMSVRFTYSLSILLFHACVPRHAYFFYQEVFSQHVLPACLALASLCKSFRLRWNLAPLGNLPGSAPDLNPSSSTHQLYDFGQVLLITSSCFILVEYHSFFIPEFLWISNEIIHSKYLEQYLEHRKYLMNVRHSYCVHVLLKWAQAQLLWILGFSYSPTSLYILLS